MDLTPILRGGNRVEQRDLYFVRREGGRRYGGNSSHALIRGDWKLMRNDPYSPLELFNLREDPAEQVDRAASEPDMAARLQRTLQEHIREGGETPWQRP